MEEGDAAAVSLPSVCEAACCERGEGGAKRRHKIKAQDAGLTSHQRAPTQKTRNLQVTHNNSGLLQLSVEGLGAIGTI